MSRLAFYAVLAGAFVVLISAIYLPILLMLRRRGKSATRQMGYLGLICAVFLIIFATILFVTFANWLTPIRLKVVANLNLVPLRWAHSAARFWGEVVPNVLMFVPLGFFLPVVFARMRRWHWTLAAVLGTTFVIEFVQYFIGRSSDIDDVIENVLGGMIGFGVFGVLNYLFVRRLRGTRGERRWEKLIGEEDGEN